VIRLQDKLIDFVAGSRNDLREKLYRGVIVVGIVMVTLGLIESVFVDGVRSNVFWVLVVLLISMIVAMWFTYKLNQSKYFAIAVVLVVDFLVFPEMFLSGGGIKGSATSWFAAGFIFVFFISTGWQSALLLLSVMALDIYMYIYAYNNPSAVSGHESDKITYIDCVFSIITVGITIGLMIIFIKKIYEKERELVLKQKKEIEQISESRNMFYTNISHELRTPITTIIGCNELIERMCEDENILKYSENIKSASRMLLSLVNDIIDMSKIEQNRMEIIETEYNVKRLFTELVEMTKVQADKKDLALNVDIDNTIPYLLQGDEKRIKQVLINLLINAVKYTNEGSIWLEAKKDKIEDNKVTLKISVRDTGIGIKKESLNLIFDTLTRVNEKENYNIEGSGLGLAISKNLIERMGGNITVDSVYSKGTTFTVYITQDIVDKVPIRDIKDNITLNTNHKYKQSFESKEAKILIVDDNYTNADIIKKLLEKTKMNIDIVMDSKSCLEATRKKIYNIIICDYLLPDMNGGELMKMVKNQENGLCKKASFMVATAVSSSEIKQIVNNYDFDGFLEKPIEPKILEESVYNLLPKEIIDYTDENVVTREIIFNNSQKKRKKKICITTDSMCAISKANIEKYGIKVMYSYVITHSGRFADMREVDAEGVLTYCASFEGYQRNKMYLAGISLEEVEQFFAETLMDADDIIHICAADSYVTNSNSVNVIAKEAAKSFAHVHIIDANDISSSQSILTLQAARMASKGFSKDEIIEKMKEQKKKMVSRVFTRAMQLEEKGEISKFKAIYYNRAEHLLMCELKKGRINILSHDKGEKKRSIKKYIRKLFMDNKYIDRNILYIVHVGYTVSEIEFLKNEISRYIHFTNVYVQKASMSVACNVGIGSLEISYVMKPKNLEQEEERIIV